MELFYAHYPSLENAFADYVARQRQNPLEPWLVVCASSLLARRLADQLARAQGAVANIHFVTASSLLNTLDAEAGPALPVFPQNHLRDFLLQEILREPGMERYTLSRGFVQALKSSLRDLADALVDPEVLEEHLQTSDDPVLAQDGERIRWLARVYRRYNEREACVPGYRSYRMMFERALAQVENSAYLKSFKRIIWYGFYDMPGRQLDLLNQLKAYYPLTVFAPYAQVPAYRFAKKFFTTNWLAAGAQCVETKVPGALGAAEPYLFEPSGSAPAEQVKIVAAANPSGEVFFAAKEILKLVEKEGYNFGDIGVLVRSQTPYEEQVRRVFAQNYIPLDASFTYPLSHFALGVFCLNLFSLCTGGFARETVLALLGSPYFKHPDKARWHRLAARSLASRDLNQWRDLLPHTDGYDPALLHWLEDCRTQLLGLDTPQPWEHATQRALCFLKDNLDETTLQGKELEILETVVAQISSLQNFAAVRAQSRAGEFTRELLEALGALSFHEVENLRGGVTFTDVQRGRGLSFKVVFILGLNEKSFPLLQPEDPILRDRYRYQLRDVLGFWINQQAERADEERLLFFTALTAARERLYGSYAQAGEDGKETVPSVYVAELARAAQRVWQGENAQQLSGETGGCIGAGDEAFLTEKEMSYRIVFCRQTAVENYRACGLLSPAKERTLRAACEIVRTGPLTDFDGCIKSGAQVFEKADSGAGFSPSSLQELAGCPMKYFFDKGLGLEEPDEAYSRRELSPDKRGTAYHEVMQDFYQELLRSGLTHELFDTGVAEYIDRALAKHYTLQSGQKFGIYPLVWEMILEEMRAQLTAFAQADVKALGAFVPSYFEREFSKLRVEDVPFALGGIIDRIDVNETEKTFAVADYKSSKKGVNDPATTFFVHLIFQPFLYLLAAEKLPQLAGYKATGACLLSIRPKYGRIGLSAEQAAALRPAATAFLRKLAEIVKSGTFFLNPGKLCTYCAYSRFCRKDSFTCLMRARKSAVSQSLEEMRRV